MSLSHFVLNKYLGFHECSGIYTHSGKTFGLQGRPLYSKSSTPAQGGVLWLVSDNRVCKTAQLIKQNTTKTFLKHKNATKKIYNVLSILIYPSFFSLSPAKD